MYCAFRYRHGCFLHRLRQRGVRVARARNIFGRGAELHRNGGFCNHVARIRADKMYTEHAIGFCIGE